MGLSSKQRRGEAERSDQAVSPGPASRIVGSLAPPRVDRLAEASGRDDLRAYFEDTWALTEWLFQHLTDECLCEQPDPRRQPLVFYLGHAAVFYVNKLRMAGLLADPVDPELESGLARGVDPKDAADLAARVWPDGGVVRTYRTQVKAEVERVIDRLELETCGPDAPVWSLLMAMEHDRIHFETSSVLMRQTDVPLTPPDGWRPVHPTESARVDAQWLRLPPRRVRLGRPGHAQTFAWDNELGRLEADVPSFDVSTTLITQHEFATFVRAGGYRERRFWSPEGWGWNQRTHCARPPFWTEETLDGGPVRSTFGLRPVVWDAPVEVTAHEAHAYTQWMSAEHPDRPEVRLPTELEWASFSLDAPRVHDDHATHPGFNLALRHHGPRPVRTSVKTPLGIHDAVGNVWQWLADDFQPLPGFEKHDLYPDFSEPYFDDQHAVLRGGSWASSGTSASRHYRLWFRRDFLQHAGFRTARSIV